MENTVDFPNEAPKGEPFVVPLTHEAFVEERYPEFHLLVKSFVQRYGEIPDQREALIHFESMVRPEKPSEPWHYWKALRSEFETLESSVYRGDVYDNDVFTNLWDLITEPVNNTSYSMLTMLKITPSFGVTDEETTGSKVKDGEEAIYYCYSCNKQKYIVGTGCTNCGYDEGDFYDHNGKPHYNAVNGESEVRNTPSGIFCHNCDEETYIVGQACTNCGSRDGDFYKIANGKNIYYYNNEPLLEEEDPEGEDIERICQSCDEQTYVTGRGCTNCGYTGDTINGDKANKLENKRLGDVIGPFCATYPTISYVLIKAGLHYPLAVIGEHPLLVAEILNLVPPKKKKTGKGKVAVGRKLVGKAGYLIPGKAKGKVGKAAKAAVPSKAKSKAKVEIEKPKKAEYNTELPRLDEDYECYAHQWVVHGKSRWVIEKLLERTVDVPKNLIRGADFESNTLLLRVLFTKDYSAHKNYMIKTLISKHISELLESLARPENLELAIIHGNHELVAKILSNPETVKEASNKNITGLLVKAIHLDGGVDEDTIVKLIAVLNSHFVIQRFYTKIQKVAEDSDSDEDGDDETDSDEEVEPDVDEEIESDERIGSDGIIKHDIFQNVGSNEVLFALMNCKNMDIETVLHFGGKRMSPLMVFMTFDEGDTWAKNMDVLLQLYEYEPLDLLLEASRLSDESIEYLLSKYEYTTEDITRALLSVPGSRGGIFSTLMKKIKSLHPDWASTEPKIFRKRTASPVKEERVYGASINEETFMQLLQKSQEHM